MHAERTIKIHGFIVRASIHTFSTVDIKTK